MSRRVVFFLTGGISSGILLGELPILDVLFTLSAISLAVCASRRRGWLIVLILCAIVVGAWRTRAVLVKYEQTVRDLTQTNELVQGVVMKMWDDRGEPMVEMSRLHNSQQRWSGHVRIRLSADEPARVGTIVRVQCRWQPAKPERRWRSAAQGLIAECYFPEAFSRTGVSTEWRAHLARIRATLIARVNRSYHSPQSDLLTGILLGVQESMPTELREGFRATGTSHIVALSGFNVTIIITVAAAALTALIGRRFAFWPMVGLVIMFVVMTGAAASVTRAGVMALVVLSCAHLGRPTTMARVLAYAFMIMVVANPLILRYDLGFQLSFLATIGLVYVSGSLEKQLHRIPAGLGLRGNLSSTIGAMMVTEPLLLWTFGRLSIVAPLVNLAVLSFIPMIMATGTLGLVLPFAVPITDALLRLVLAIIGTAAGWSFAQTTTPWWVAGGLAMLAVYFVVRCLYDTAKKTSLDR